MTTTRNAQTLVKHGSAMQAITQLMPRLTMEEWQFIQELPREFCLDAPYIMQEEPHWSAAACAQMILSFYNLPVPSQRDLADACGWADVKSIRYESFSDGVAQYLLANAGLLPAAFGPGAHIHPKVADGVLATDFVRSHLREIIPLDHLFFKAILVSTRSPLLVRIHFTTYDYPMDEDWAQYLDVSGHAMLIVGYDERGFICHDPWDKKRWGGALGGSYSHFTYKTLSQDHVPVNCTNDRVMHFSQIETNFFHASLGTYPERQIPIKIGVRWSGVASLHPRLWYISKIAVKLTTPGTLVVPSEPILLEDIELLPGQEIVVEAEINTGKEYGSNGISASIEAEVSSDQFAWINGDNRSRNTVKAQADYRVSVQSLNFLKNYGVVTP